RNVRAPLNTDAPSSLASCRGLDSPYVGCYNFFSPPYSYPLASRPSGNSIKQMSEFIRSVEQFILEKRLFSPGQKIVLAVSGGLDSMVLLHVLQLFSRQHGWTLVVAHFNHQLRGRSSDADEALVRRTAQRLQIPFVAGRAEVKRFAEEEKLSVE